MKIFFNDCGKKEQDKKTERKTFFRSDMINIVRHPWQLLKKWLKKFTDG